MIICRTPFRISFFGGGTDYPAWFEQHGGAFVSTTIDKYCYIMCRRLPPFFEVKGRISWSKIENVNTVDEIENPVIRECLRFMKMEPRVDIHYHGDLPARSGLGSSSAFTVGLLHALHALNNKHVSKRVLASEAIKVEQECIGDVVGVQDQTAAAYGGLNHCEIGRDGKVDVLPVIMSPERRREFESHVLLFFTGIVRNATNIAKSQVMNFGERTRELTRIRELVDESLRLLHNGGSFVEFGHLLHEGWKMKRALSSAVSTDFIENAYEAAMKAGAVGGKILGAGGGGFLMVFAQPHRHAQVIEALKDLLHVPIRFETRGTQVIFHEPEEQMQFSEMGRAAFEPA